MSDARNGQTKPQPSMPTAGANSGEFQERRLPWSFIKSSQFTNRSFLLFFYLHSCLQPQFLSICVKMIDQSFLRRLFHLHTLLLVTINLLLKVCCYQEIILCKATKRQLLRGTVSVFKLHLQLITFNSVQHI